MQKNDEILSIKRIKKSDLPLPACQNGNGLDLRTSVDIVIEPEKKFLIPTGFSFALPKGSVGLIKDRSGLARKGLHVLAGVIDEDYRGEIGILLINLGRETFRTKKGSRIAQLLILPTRKVKVVEKKRLSSTSRGRKGWGSSGLF
ncbi:MAG: dUTP diphosphatase [Candidatus Omnitrophica bacterium]|nr:dUTP diphosphatase [Candidatus Omnitrophota bacterium]